MPFKDPAAATAYHKDRRNTDTYRVANKARMKARYNPKPFIGVDGEGGQIDGTHEYLLLRVGEHMLHRNNRPLRTRDILLWLTSLPREGIYVGFGFDYDVTMILRDIPPDILARLYDRESRQQGRTLTPITWRGYAIEYLPRKHFRVARIVKGQKLSWFTVHDVIGFYQSSFVQALEAWDIGTPDIRGTIRAMKLRRADFTTATVDEIEYNRLECVLLAELVTALRAAVNDAGYSITNYEGAGCLAQAMLSKHEAPEKVTYTADLFAAAKAAYYGGRFEISRIGVVAPVHEYDLASAYPWAMSVLPCLDHGRWVNEFADDNPNQIIKVAWHSNRPWGPLPFRDPDGTILYPSDGIGWYWAREVAVAEKYDSVVILEAWHWESHCDHTPFTWIRDVFAERQRIGKASKGKVLKLGLNSLYGKMAQSVGTPKYANPMFAGMITAHIRALMSQVCAEYGNHVVMVATDGIYLDCPMESDKPIHEPGSKAGLGDWEHQPFTDMFLVKPGIYFTSDGAKVKTRGIPRWQLDEKRDAITAAWERDGLAGVVAVQRRMFIGGRLAVSQNRPEDMGQWIDTTLNLSYASNYLKRAFTNAGTSTLHDRRGKTSTPYKKDFGVDIAADKMWEDLDMMDT